jgi:hypothetical protein
MCYEGPFFPFKEFTLCLITCISVFFTFNDSPRAQRLVQAYKTAANTVVTISLDRLHRLDLGTYSECTCCCLARMQELKYSKITAALLTLAFHNTHSLTLSLSHNKELQMRS